MFSPKHLIGLILTSLLFVSCAPFPPNHGKQQPNPANVPEAVKVETKAKTKTPAELKKEADRNRARIKANKEAAARRAKKKKEEEAANNTGGGSNVTPPSVPDKPIVKPKSKYRTAMSIPGKPGFVFNPWTNKAVDVRGIPGGSVVRDPNDGNADHKFRVP